jgi:hypothetical protein
VNGKSDVVGRDRAELDKLIARNDRGNSGPELNFAGDTVTVTGGAKAAGDVWLVRYDPRVVQVPIKRGENGGRTLPHRNIVRELVKIGEYKGGNATFKLPAGTQNGLLTASFIQQGRGGPIVAAARS